jgi:hypothetical protein
VDTQGTRMVPGAQMVGWQRRPRAGTRTSGHRGLRCGGGLRAGVPDPPFDVSIPPSFAGFGSRWNASVRVVVVTAWDTVAWWMPACDSLAIRSVRQRAVLAGAQCASGPAQTPSRPWPLTPRSISGAFAGVSPSGASHAVAHKVGPAG